jgi:2-(1,2-epoxy-1,2-dihydrophenyl)acetyl-CoA isomerase
VRRAAIRTLEEQLEDEERLIQVSAADPESREGVAAFLAQRRPDFRSTH